jgi:hypothetical protein
MSAWIVAKAHVDALVTAALVYAQSVGRTMMPEDCDKLGATLWAENHKSVGYRYSHKETMPPYRFTRRAVPLTPVELLKAVACFEYQSCEHKGWEKSEAHKACAEIRNIAINALPGYADAPWGIDR